MAAWKLNDKGSVEVGNLDAQRDWGYVPEYVELMWRILNHDKPDNFVAVTGKTKTVRRCIEVAFAYVGVAIEWRGEGVDKVGVHGETGDVFIKVNRGPMTFHVVLDHINYSQRNRQLKK